MPGPRDPRESISIGQADAMEWLKRVAVILAVVGLGVLLILRFTERGAEQGCIAPDPAKCLPPVPCGAAGTIDRNPGDRPVAPRRDQGLLPEGSAAELPFGFNDSAVLVGQATLEEDMQLHRAVGSTLIREPLDWGAVEPTPGEFDFSRPDATYCAALASGVRPLFHITGVPPWALDTALKHCAAAPCVAAPLDENLDEMQRFAELAAIRYPEVAAFEAWNEPNLTMFWPAPDPARYTEVLRVVYTGVKNGNPKTPVLGGSLSNNQIDSVTTGDISLATFLSGIVEAGAGAYMDALSIHVYPTRPLDDPRQVFDATLSQAREALSLPGANLPDRLWVTEAGIPTLPGSPSSPGVAPEEQEETILGMYEELATSEDVDAVLFHTLVDPNTLVGGGLGWGWVGGPETNFAPKPVYCEFAQRFGPEQGPC